MSRPKFFCVTLVICSAVFCETSSIFDFLRRTASSSSTTLPSSVRSDEQQHTVEYTTGPDAEYLEYTTHEPLSAKRDVSGRGGGGWGWGHGGHDSSLDLYSLLGGLSFASLLGATIVYLARRSQSTTMMMMNNSGKRRRRDLDDLDDELQGESLAEFLGRLGVHIDNPWWNREPNHKKPEETPGEPNISPFCWLKTGNHRPVPLKVSRGNYKIDPVVQFCTVGKPRGKQVVVACPACLPSKRNNIHPEEKEEEGEEEETLIIIEQFFGGFLKKKKKVVSYQKERDIALMENPSSTSTTGHHHTSNPAEICLEIAPTTGGTFDFRVKQDESIDNLKKSIAKKLKVSKEQICLLHRDRHNVPNRVY
ncbi:unnamed protein product [Allacma fusca]|uniref:Ubiquitin-like domain-containing protein n=1 Tax=Allacma fusca TaxID=39272 RepID=A0A8J2LLF1_9HEXA|nr:unnamed protein product [Allacma fusca]